MQIGSKYGCLTVLECEEKLIKCQCKCGKIHYYDLKTVESEPKYCRYPMYRSTRMTYSNKSKNATYRKCQKYGDLMNVVFVASYNDCCPSDDYCDLWNQYKKKQMNKKATSANPKKKYTVKEWDKTRRKWKEYEVEAVSHLAALRTLFPDDVFELCPKSDIRNRYMMCGNDYDFEVSNDYSNSAQNRSKRYKRKTQHQ